MRRIVRVLDDLDTPEALRNTVLIDALDAYMLAESRHLAASERWARGRERGDVAAWRRWLEVSEYALYFARRSLALALQATVDRPGDEGEVYDVDNLDSLAVVTVRYAGRFVAMCPDPDADAGPCDYRIVIAEDRGAPCLDLGPPGIEPGGGGEGR